jgi:hypothetical protein
MLSSKIKFKPVKTFDYTQGYVTMFFEFKFEFDLFLLH